MELRLHKSWGKNFHENCLFGQGTELFTFAIYIYFTQQQENMNRVHSFDDLVFGLIILNLCATLATDQKCNLIKNWAHWAKHWAQENKVLDYYQKVPWIYS